MSTNLDAAHDAATAVDGSAWRMPTWAEVQELIDNCTYEFVTVDGVAGGRLISNINGNSIFIPAAGYLRNTSGVYVGVDGFVWTASYGDETHVNRLRVSESVIQVGPINNRIYGFNVRGVSDP